MNAATHSCQFVGLMPVFIKQGVDRTEYYDERGAFYENREIPCKRVADPSEKYCPRHKLLVATLGGKEPERYQCEDCKKTFKQSVSGCHKCGGEVVEIPVETNF